MDKNDLIFGIHAVHAALANNPQQILEVWLDKKRLEKKHSDKHMADIYQLVQKAGIASHEVGREQLDRMLPQANHQGVIARCDIPKTLAESDLLAIVENLLKPALLLILDGVQDPHNLGACIRSADGAGVDAVVVPKDKSAGLTSVVVKVASGAIQSVPLVQVTNLARTMDQLKKAGVWMVGTDDQGEQYMYGVDFTMPVALVMGAEGSGLRRLTKEKCDFLVKLPMEGVVTSLNVSVATGICLYEALRQRKYSKN